MIFFFFFFFFVNMKFIVSQNLMIKISIFVKNKLVDGF